MICRPGQVVLYVISILKFVMLFLLSLILYVLGNIIIINMPITFLLTLFISCCSVIFERKLNSNLTFKFTVSGGTIMTIYDFIKKLILGAGVCGFCVWNHAAGAGGK